MCVCVCVYHPRFSRGYWGSCTSFISLSMTVLLLKLAKFGDHSSYSRPTGWCVKHKSVSLKGHPQDSPGESKQPTRPVSGWASWIFWYSLFSILFSNITSEEKKRALPKPQACKDHPLQFPQVRARLRPPHFGWSRRWDLCSPRHVAQGSWFSHFISVPTRPGCCVTTPTCELIKHSALRESPIDSTESY